MLLGCQRGLGLAVLGRPSGTPARRPARRELACRPSAKILGADQAAGALQLTSVPDLGSWITTGTLAAAQLLPQLTGKSLPFSLDANVLFTVLAWYTLLYAVTSLIQKKLEFDSVGTVIGPAYLAAHALGGRGPYLTPPNVATALFGFFLSSRLPGPHVVWIVTLVGALYAGKGPEWVVAVFAGGAAWKLVQGLQRRTLPLSQVVFLGAAAVAVTRRCLPEFMMMVFLGQILAAACGQG